MINEVMYCIVVYGHVCCCGVESCNVWSGNVTKPVSRLCEVMFCGVR